MATADDGNPEALLPGMNGGKEGILILGGGFGGLAVARLLGRYPKTVERAGLEPVLVDRVRHHVYTPLLYEVASGCMVGNDMAAGVELTEGVSLHFDALLKECCGVRAIEGEVVAVDARARRVRLASGTTLPYRYAVLALGAETDYYNIPGLHEYSYALKRRSHAMLIRQRIQEFIDQKRRREEVQIQIMVGGGGPTGVEFSAEMASCFRRMVAAGELADGDWSVTLVEASPRLLGGLAPEVSDHALRRLKSLGVKVLRDTCIRRADHGGVVLSPRPLRPGESVEALVCDFRTSAEKRFEADVLVWTGGVRAPEITGSLGVTLDAKGRIVVDATMAVAGVEGLFAIGDCASLADPKTKRPVPQIAQAALAQADVAARNVIREISHKKLLNYQFTNYPAIIPLGGKNAIAVLGHGLVIRGFLGWIIRQLADLRYFLRVLQPRAALRVFLLGARLYTQND